MNDRISISPSVCHGRPVIKGTRVLVSNILAALAAGEAVETILTDYPGITRQDIAAALAFASELARFEELPEVPVTA
jgi:uncharacterized protein (DUF433 family)